MSVGLNVVEWSGVSKQRRVGKGRWRRVERDGSCNSLDKYSIRRKRERGIIFRAGDKLMVNCLADPNSHMCAY